MANETERERLEREYVEAGGCLSPLHARLRMTVEQRFDTHQLALALTLDILPLLLRVRAKLKAP